MNKVQPPPAPWFTQDTYGVGGLLAIGYAPNTDFLLVISSQGRGIFDCRTGERIARDYDNADNTYDEIALTAQGFGPLVNTTVPISGLYGGGLPRGTYDGWALQAVPDPWPHHSIVLEYPYTSIYTNIEHGVKVGDDGSCELRAYGFSPTGQSFVVALSCELTVFTRSTLS